jgi:mono/diheme cytochrome c family protein
MPMNVKKLSKALLTAAGAFAITGGLAAALFVHSGLYNVAATSPHSQAFYTILQWVGVRSIERRTDDIIVPDLSRPGIIARGLDLYRANCVQCHGAPGIAADNFAYGLTPAPPPLAETARLWDARSLYWVTRHGMKMTAMPAWEFRMPDDDIWAVVAFLRTLPDLSPADYARMAQRPVSPAKAIAPAAAKGHVGDPARGRLALHQYACNMCHEIPGVSGPPALVGPPLDGVAKRVYIAGVLSNTPANMRLWIQHPQSVKPLSAMPDLGVSDEHARDMIAYLYKLR